MTVHASASQLRLICTCARGTEKALKFEMKACGAENTRSLNGAVEGTGSVETMARLNIQSRIAHHVLWEVHRFKATDEDSLYDGVYEFPVEEYWSPQLTLATKAHLFNAPMTHDKYVTLRVKDALVDRLREKKRAQPILSPRDPDMRFILFWNGEDATLSIDTSGKPLHQRGYRPSGAIAPMRETLAAAMLAIGHADVTRPFYDPCCGSGTLGIEQAFRALKWAPGRHRRFGCERWGNELLGTSRAFKHVRGETASEEKQSLDAPIVLSDWHPKAVQHCTDAISAAGLDEHLTVQRQDARKVSFETARPVICSNLPFGERLSQNTLQLDGFYRTLGETFSALPGARILVLTTHPYAEKLFGLGTPKRWPLYSGPLKAKLRKWDLAE